MLLVYNTRIHAYCCVELKTGSFEASHLGQLGLYVTAVNHQLKTEYDNPTIGLLVCKDNDNIETQYSLRYTIFILEYLNISCPNLFPKR